MKNRKSKAVLALGVLAAGVIAAGGAAFTNSTTLPTTTAGYGSTNISGAHAQSVVYGYSPQGDKIYTVTVVLDSPGDGSPASPIIDFSQGYTVKGGFNADEVKVCTVGQRTQVGGTGTYTNTVVCSGDLPVDPGTGFNQDTATAMSFSLLVTNN
jgi:hypothetical protein